jgi:hypothetical protein
MDVHPSHQLAEHEPGDAGAAANFRVADYIGEWTNADPNTSEATPQTDEMYRSTGAWID